MAKLKRIINLIAIHVAGLFVIYAIMKQLGLTASLIMIGALIVVYFTLEDDKQTKEEAE